MDNKVLKDALRRRRGRKFDAKNFEPKAGMDSQDLGEVREVEMGRGVNDELVAKESADGKRSTDELAPSRKEMGLDDLKPFKDAPKSDDGGFVDTEMSSVTSDVGGNADDEVFDQAAFDSGMRKKKPKSLYERMQLGLGAKLRK